MISLLSTFLVGPSLVPPQLSPLWWHLSTGSSIGLLALLQELQSCSSGSSPGVCPYSSALSLFHCGSTKTGETQGSLHPVRGTLYSPWAGASENVLVLLGIEFTFLSVASTVLGLGFRVRIKLTATTKPSVMWCLSKLRTFQCLMICQ